MRNLFFLALCFVAIVTKAQQPTDPSYLKGMELQQAKKYPKAIKEFTKAIEKNPNNHHFFVERAKCHAINGNYQSAYDDLQESLKVKPKNEYAYLLLARLFFEINNKQEAVNNADMALKYATVDSIKKQTHLVRGDAKQGLLAYKDAYEEYKKVLSFDSTDIAALNNISLSLLELNRATEGLTYLERILRIDSVNIAAICNFGYIYQRQGNYEKSITYYKKALKLDPLSFIAWNNMGYSKFLNGNVEEGLLDVNKSILLNAKNSYAFRNRALIYLKKENTDKACEDLYMAKYLGFTDEYGNEVINLIDEHCKK